MKTSNYKLKYVEQQIRNTEINLFFKNVFYHKQKLQFLKKINHIDSYRVRIDRKSYRATIYFTIGEDKFKRMIR